MPAAADLYGRAGHGARASTFMNHPDEQETTPWEELAEVGKYPTLEQAQEHGLVILAMREPCWVEDADAQGGYKLHATPDSAPQITRELEAYAREQAVKPPPALTAREVFPYPAGWAVYGLWALALILSFAWQGGHPSWVEHAASSSEGLIGRGEWWRPFTALFLHGDLPHLLGNLLSGLLFGTLVARSLGAWRGWALILASGVAGNTLTSLLTWPDSFVSIGASTAVFGALGILAGLGFSHMLRFRLHLPWARTAAPVVAGIVLLGWLGGGSPGGNTDVLGHVFGFGSGLAAGVVTGQLTRQGKHAD